MARSWAPNASGSASSSGRPGPSGPDRPARRNGGSLSSAKSSVRTVTGRPASGRKHRGEFRQVLFVGRPVPGAEEGHLGPQQADAWARPSGPQAQPRPHWPRWPAPRLMRRPCGQLGYGWRRAGSAGRSRRRLPRPPRRAARHPDRRPPARGWVSSSTSVSSGSSSTPGSTPKSTGIPSDRATIPTCAVAAPITVTAPATDSALSRRSSAVTSHPARTKAPVRRHYSDSACPATAAASRWPTARTSAARAASTGSSSSARICAKYSVAVVIA